MTNIFNGGKYLQTCIHFLAPPGIEPGTFRYLVGHSTTAPPPPPVWYYTTLSLIRRRVSIPSRPRSRLSRTKRSTWLFCRSTSSTSRRFYDSSRLGRFPIDWSTCGHFDHNFLLVLAHWQLTRTILCPSI